MIKSIIEDRSTQENCILKHTKTLGCISST